MTTEEQAKAELKEAWERVKALEVTGLEFGGVCYKWHKWYIQEKPKDKGDRIRFMWKSLGIPHTTAYHYMEQYAASVGEGKKPEIETYTAQERKRNQQRSDNEHRLESYFKDSGFEVIVKQNCSTTEHHFNVTFYALSEARAKELAKLIKRRK
jgi:hypothetical protein